MDHLEFNSSGAQGLPLDNRHQQMCAPKSLEGNEDLGLGATVTLTGIANLLGLNRLRGTSLGMPNQNQCPSEANQFGISPGSNGGGVVDSRYGFMTPPDSGNKKKRFFETPPSPDYYLNSKSSRSVRDHECEMSLDNTGHMMGINSGSRSGSPADSGISLGTSLTDHRFADNISELVSKMKMGSPGSPHSPHSDHSGNSAAVDADLAKLQAFHAMPNSHVNIPRVNQLHYYQHQQMLNQLIDNPWLAQQLMAAPREGANSLERAARYHRSAASMCEATCTWSGVLPARTLHKSNALFSCKVFLGGVPWDITESTLISSFRQFGNARVEWPGKENATTLVPKGYVYLIFENDKQVKALLQACTHDFAKGVSWYYKISSRKMKAKEVQVIPWLLTDSNCVKSTSQKLDPQKTVFVGALHGMLNAEGLSHIMDDLFENVIYAGIDTDKHKYPIGSGRVTFSNPRSYMRAVAAAFIEIKTSRFSKKVQVDPYLEDSLCSVCQIQQGPYFCREMICFRYFCRSCWQWHHSMDATRSHKPLMRNSKTSPVHGFSAGPRTSN